VLLIHGTGASKNAFARQFESPLAQRFRLIALDLPGHGDSADAGDVATYGVPGLGRAAAEVLDALRIEHAAVYGWSLGGHVAMELLSYHPAIAGLMLGGAPPVPKGPLGLLRGFHAGFDMLLASKAQFSERDVQRFAQLCFGNEVPAAFLADMRRSDGRCRTQFMRSVLRGDGADQRQAVERATVPIAFLNGEHERFVRLSYLDGVGRIEPWGKGFEVIAGAGHAPFWQQAEAFNDRLSRFAADVAAAAARPAIDTRQRRAG
jgi:pimeloyl-ACP methyl ester carboxylesterase